MTAWQAFFLGIIQGITEFLPVSSSGHLTIGQYLFGLEDQQSNIFFNLVCHLGTLGSILYLFFSMRKNAIPITLKGIWYVALGTLPLVPLLFILKPLKVVLENPKILGPCFVISALLLFTSSYWQLPFRKRVYTVSWIDSLVIGVFQSVAIFPGISRSGATISAARLLGWDKQQAIHYSFLLAIPAILGGVCIEGWKGYHAPSESLSSISPFIFIIGFCTSCVMGYFSLKFLINCIIQNKWVYFAWYCLFLGMFITIYFNN